MTETKPTIDQMKQELLAAGWKAKTPVIWKSPHGALFLGPYGAWKVLKGIGNWDSRGKRAEQ